MIKIADIKIIEADWVHHYQQLSKIRREVFIIEQDVPQELEWDGVDDSCRHVLALDMTQQVTLQAIGTGRLAASEKNIGHLGRMAICKAYRCRGIGTKILQQLIDFAKYDGYTQVYLHAQLTAVEFYQHANFKAQGEPFMDAGILHIKMNKYL